MPGRRDSGLLREYVAVLRGIGLTEPAIVEAHGDREQPEGTLEEYVRARLPGTEESDLHGALVDAIAGSARGIDAPAEYWNHAPEVHLDELLAPYGCTVSVEPARRADSLAEGQLVVSLSDATGTEFWTRFDYPETALGEDNYPSLIQHVQEQLLGGTGLRLVRLVAPKRRWRFAMMTEAQLDALRQRYGERIEVFGAPLLHEHQPTAFAGEEPPVPSWYESTAAPIEDDGDLAIDVPQTTSLDDLEPTEAELQFDDLDASPDSIVETVEEGSAGSGSTAEASGADGVEASDDQLESVFGDLSDVSLEPDDPEPEPSGGSGGGTVAIDGGTPAATDGADPMDDLFDELKRDIADSEPTTGENASAGRETSVTELVEDVGSDPQPSGDDSDDVPQDAADLTASELFSGMDEDT